MAIAMRLMKSQETNLKNVQELTIESHADQVGTVPHSQIDMADENTLGSDQFSSNEKLIIIAKKTCTSEKQKFTQTAPTI